MIKILYVDACLKRDSGSRTECLAQAYLKKRLADGDCSVSTLILENTVMHPLSEKDLSKREKAIAAGDFAGSEFDLAREFAAADEVVIAAPYWDMSFPAALKLYVEQLCINKLTFCYNENGVPCGMTAIKKAIYFTTAGGYIGSSNFGFEYIKGVFSSLFGIGDIRFFSAEGLDIYGNDPEKILADSIEKMYRDLS